MAWFELAYEAKRNKNNNNAFDRKAFDAAVKEASEGVTEAAGDFSDFERPPFMRNSLGRFFLQFKMFSFITTKFFMKSAWGLMHAETPREKMRVAKELSTVLLMGMVFSGYTGLPLYSTGAWVLDKILAGLEDDDDEDKKKRRAKNPLTADSSDRRFREYMADVFGEKTVGSAAEGEGSFKWSHLLSDGLISTLTGADWSSRTSYDGLWVRQGMEGDTFKETARNFLLANLAPGISMADSMLGGIDDFARGDITRGLAKMVPGLVKGIPNAIRYNTEGVANTRGDVMIKPEDITTLDTLNTLLGFQLSRASLLNEEKSFRIAATNRQKNAKVKLLAAFNDSLFDPSLTREDRREFGRRIGRYNKRYPDEHMQITMDTLKASRDAYIERKRYQLYGSSITKENARYTAPSIRAAAPPK